MKLTVGVAMAVAVMVWGRTAIGDGATHAAPGAGIVIESFTGPRSADAERWLAPVLEEMEPHGFASGVELVGSRYEVRVSRPAHTESGIPDDFASQVDAGHEAQIHGKFQQAVDTLTPLVEAAESNPAIIAQHQGLREYVKRALISLALSKQRLGETAGALNTMSELVRSFPDVVVSRATDGPEAITLHDEAIKALDKDGHGTLIVNVGDPNAIVFVDERFERQGDLVKPDVRPGTYRIYVQRGKVEGRVYAVKVEPGVDARVDIDLDYDAALHTSPDWTGLTFADEHTRDQREAQYTARFAKGIDARSAVAIGIGTEAGHPAVVGVIVDINTGREIDRRSVPLDPDPPIERLRDLGRFLATGAFDPTRVAAGHEERLSATSPRADGWTWWGGWPWIAGAVAIGGAATGGYMLHLDGRQACGDPPCKYLYGTTGEGIAFIGGGVALGVLSGLLFVRAHHHHHSHELSVAPLLESGGYMVQLGGEF